MARGSSTVRSRMKISLTVNGALEEHEVEPRTWDGGRGGGGCDGSGAHGACLRSGLGARESGSRRSPG